MEKIQDNTIRGSRTLLFIRMFFSIVAVFASVILLARRVNDSFENFQAMAFSMIAFMIVLWGLFVLALVFFCCMFFYWIAWLYRAESNLRCMVSTEFSPLIAVVCTCIPFLGYVLHFFIFDDLVEQQRVILEKRNLRYVQVPRVMMRGWLVLGLMGIFAALLSTEFEICTYIFFALVLGAAVCYEKCFGVYINQEKILAESCQNEIFEKRVNRIVQERENYKAEEMLKLKN